MPCGRTGWRALVASTFTGDVAAIALAAGSCCVELAQDLPRHLVTGLEDGPFGRRYLGRLNRQLLARSGP